MKISELKPSKVFEFFEMLSSVPHGSDNIAQISELCCDFARQRNLEYIQDEVGNVIIFKPAAKGYEEHEPVIIQGHMDMVAVKTPDCDIDLLTDGLRLRTDGEWLWADGTSLGGDDGIAIAMAMAILDSDDIPHPPIEALFTINEETGMDGAVFLDTSVLKGRRMLNLDSEEEGIITVGCAGGARVYGEFKLNLEAAKMCHAALKIKGLTGGHSGAEIQKHRANSNKLMGELLRLLSEKFDIRLISVDGGEKDNAIANATSAVIAYSPEYSENELSAAVLSFAKTAVEKYSSTDPDMEIVFENLGVKDLSCADAETTHSVISAMCTVPDGVQTMSADIEGLVETSLNFGVLKTESDTVSITFCLRSSVRSEKEALIKLVSDIIFDCGGNSTYGSEYPAWEYRKDSPLRDALSREYERQSGKAPVITVIHAGLECGLFSEKIKGLDCVSIGPDMLDIHTTGEKLNIPSTQRTWELVKALLAKL